VDRAPEQRGRHFVPRIGQEWTACNPRRNAATRKRRARDIGTTCNTVERLDRNALQAFVTGLFNDQVCRENPHTSATLLWKNACLKKSFSLGGRPMGRSMGPFIVNAGFQEISARSFFTRTADPDADKITEERGSRSSPTCAKRGKGQKKACCTKLSKAPGSLSKRSGGPRRKPSGGMLKTISQGTTGYQGSASTFPVCRDFGLSSEELS